MNYIKLFLIAFPIFLLIDFIWLGIVSPGFYSKELGSLARRVGDSLSLNWSPALLSYLLIVLGIVFFVIPKVGDEGKTIQFLFWGFLFGIIVYGVYDLVNLATLKNWSLKMTIIDMIWGGVVCGLVSAITSFVYKLLS